jgi:hypothetical protein
MAREIHEREDLLRDAVALVPRIRLRVTINGKPCEVFAGFRGESLSLYFGGDPVYQFNAAGELRRAFVDDRLVKAERRRLVFMKRQQRANETALERQPHDAVTEQSLLAGLQHGLNQLRAAIANGQYVVVGEAPENGEALPRLGAWLDAYADVKIAASPRVT